MVKPRIVVIFAIIDMDMTTSFGQKGQDKNKREERANNNEEI